MAGVRRRQNFTLGTMGRKMRRPDNLFLSLLLSRLLSVPSLLRVSSSTKEYGGRAEGKGWKEYVEGW